MEGLIVWGNQGASAQVYGGCGTPTYSVLDTQNLPGATNSNADPVFRMTGNIPYRIAPGSPCVDFVVQGNVTNVRDFGLHRRPHSSTYIPDCGPDEVPFYSFVSTVPIDPGNPTGN